MKFLTATIEEKKEYLRQLEKLEQEIEIDKMVLESMRSTVYGSSVCYDYNGNPNVKTSAFQDALVNIELHKTFTEAKVHTLIKKKMEVQQAINDSVSDITRRKIMIQKYISYKSIPLIAVEMGKDVSWIYGLHRRALEEFKIPDEETTKNH